MQGAAIKRHARSRNQAARRSCRCAACYEYRAACKELQSRGMHGVAIKRLAGATIALHARSCNRAACKELQSSCIRAQRSCTRAACYAACTELGNLNSSSAQAGEGKRVAKRAERGCGASGAWQAVHELRAGARNCRCPRSAPGKAAAMRKALRLMKKLSARYSEWQWEARSETCRGLHQRVRSPMGGA